MNTLLALGFSEEEASHALRLTNNDVIRASNLLLDGPR
jgi:hypothetical protein